MTLIPFDDRDGVIWFNGKLIPWRDANIHVLSHGLHYASCVFEGERVYGGQIFKLTEHTERLFHSAQVLGFEIPSTVAALEDASREIIAAQNITDGYVRPVAWRGSEMMAVSAQHSTIHLAIAAWEWPSYFAPEARLNGIRLATAKWRRPAPDTAPTNSKAAGLYMICTLAKHEAEAKGYDDALMLDYRGRVAETTSTNIFMVIKGELHTPTPDCFLDGITRRTVIGLAAKHAIKVVERAIMPDEIGQWDEVFVTGTAAEVTPVGEIDGHRFVIGPVTQLLMEDYDVLVRAPEEATSAA